MSYWSRELTPHHSHFPSASELHLNANNRHIFHLSQLLGRFLLFPFPQESQILTAGNGRFIPKNCVSIKAPCLQPHYCCEGKPKGLVQPLWGAKKGCGEVLGLWTTILVTQEAQNSPSCKPWGQEGNISLNSFLQRAVMRERQGHIHATGWKNHQDPDWKCHMDKTQRCKSAPICSKHFITSTLYPWASCQGKQHLPALFWLLPGQVFSILLLGHKSEIKWENRVTGSLGLEKISKMIKSNLWPILTSSPSQSSECHFQLFFNPAWILHLVFHRKSAFPKPDPHQFTTSGCTGLVLHNHNLEMYLYKLFSSKKNQIWEVPTLNIHREVSHCQAWNFSYIYFFLKKRDEQGRQGVFWV